MLARLAQLGEARRPAAGVGQRRVAAPATAAGGHHQRRTGAGQVGDHGAVGRMYDRAVRYPQDQVLPACAVPVPALAGAPVGGLGVRPEMEVQQRVYLRIHGEHDVPPMPPVTAVRPPERLELLPVDRRATVPAVTRQDVQHDPVDERGHGCSSLNSTVSVTGRKAGEKQSGGSEAQRPDPPPVRTLNGYPLRPCRLRPPVRC